MSDILRPDSEAQLCEAISWANSDEVALELCGSGGKRDLGRPMVTGYRLDMTAFSGIHAYEPEELVLTAGAATPLAEIDAALAQAGQELAFEPPDYRALLGGAATNSQPTLGGVLGGNLCGPRRLKAGAARDHFLGFKGVSGRGEAFKSGGRVVKNVTGYDLCKLLCGSWGTLAALHEVSVKTMPRAEDECTLLLPDQTIAAGVAHLARGLNSPADVSGAAWLPPVVAARSAVAIVADVAAVAGAEAGLAAFRLEGFAPSVRQRARGLKNLFRDLGLPGPLTLSQPESAAFWRELRDVTPFAGNDSRVVWRIALAPADAPAVVQPLQDIRGAEFWCDWAGGLLWFAADAPNTGAEALLRETVNAHGGSAMLFRAPEALRRTIPVFHPQTPALAALTGRIKAGFDPNAILNPGRMYAGV